MSLIKNQVINILREKNNEISLQIINVIDIFNEQELIELKTILSQNNPNKLKEALLYKHTQFKKTIDKIIELQKEFQEIKNNCLKRKKEIENNQLDKNLDNLLDNI